MKILICYGTLTMNTEMVASHLYDGLSESEHTIDLINVIDISNADFLLDYDVFFVGTSTWGEGEYPPDTEEFDSLLRTSGISLQSKKAAFFGLGDSSYEVYNGGIKLLSKLFVEDLEVEKVGDTYLIDGFPEEENLLEIVSWAKKIVQRLA